MVLIKGKRLGGHMNIIISQQANGKSINEASLINPLSKIKDLNLRNVNRKFKYKIACK